MSNGKLLAMFLVAMLLVGLTGCEKYDPNVMQAYAAQSQQVGEQLSDLQESLAPALESIKSNDLVDPSIVEKIDKANEEINRVKPQLANVAKELQKHQFKSKGLGGMIETAQVVNGATESFNPYAVPISLGLTVLSSLLGFAARKQRDAKVEAKTALSETVQAIEAFKVESDVGNKELLTNLSKAQSRKTKLMVSEITT